MVLLHPPIYITLLPCKITWKQAKRISSRRGDVYLLIKNTCSCKNEKHVFSIRRANCHRTNVIRFWGGVQVWMYIGYFITISVLHAVKIFGAKIFSSYNHLLPKLLDNLWFTCFFKRIVKLTEPQFWSKNLKLLFISSQLLFIIEVMNSNNCWSKIRRRL